MVFHWNNSGKNAVNLDKIGGSIIPVEFHQNSTVIPDVYLWNSGGIPPEYCFKIPAVFLERCFDEPTGQLMAQIF